MKKKMKNAVITSFLGKTKDRFHEYNEGKTLEEKFEMISEMNYIDGVEVVFPYEVNDPVKLKQLKEKYKVNIAAINVNVKAEPEFLNGGLTSSKKEVREKAVQFIKDAKYFAREVNADKVTCCPLGDGYEFAFQADYTKTWEYLVETFKEAGSYLKEIPLFIEYKPSETRGRCFVDTASKTLCLLNKINVKGMGVTVDFGHSIYGDENPAEVVALLAENNTPYYIHINDNNGKWDWDYFVGSKHILSYIEFIYYLKRYDYSDYLTSDTSPTRWDIKRTFENNGELTNRIYNKLEEIDIGKLKKQMRRDEYLDTWEFICENFFGF
ncbi:MAG: sugar phosphate isomerase/epimerase family protein [bacterium]